MENEKDIEELFKDLVAICMQIGWKCIKVHDLEDETHCVGFIMGEEEFCSTVMSVSEENGDLH